MEKGVLTWMGCGTHFSPARLSSARHAAHFPFHSTACAAPRCLSRRLVVTLFRERRSSLATKPAGCVSPPINPDAPTTRRKRA
jgi:hypothetical protein